MSEYIIDSADLARLQERIRNHVEAPIRQDAARAWDAEDWARHHREGEALLEDVERLLVRDELDDADLEAKLRAEYDDGYDDADLEAKLRAEYDDGYDDGYDEGKEEGRHEGYEDGVAVGKARAEAAAKLAQHDDCESVLDELVKRGKRS